MRLHKGMQWHGIKDKKKERREVRLGENVRRGGERQCLCHFDIDVMVH